LATEREWEIEKERAAMQNNRFSRGSRRAARGEIYHLLPKMDDADTLVFFQTFEGALQINEIDKSEWPKFLPAHLTPKANKVLSSLSLSENMDYETCKRAVLSYFKLDSHAYLKAFRTTRRSRDENYKMFKNRLKEILLYFVEAKEIDTFETLADAVLHEHVVNLLLADVKQFVISKQPRNADECSEYADLYCEVSRNTGGQGQGQGHPSKHTRQPDASLRQIPRADGVNKPAANGSNTGT